MSIKPICLAFARPLLRAPRTPQAPARSAGRPLTTAPRPFRHQLRRTPCQILSARYESTAATTTASTDPSPSSQPERKAWRAAPHRRPDEPVYELYFTCKVCKHRSGHSVSKQGYHNGTVLVNCPGCSNRHLISDHLKIFYDKSVTLEDLMREKGEGVRLGGVDQEGDVEFWEHEAVVDAEKEG